VVSETAVSTTAVSTTAVSTTAFLTTAVSELVLGKRGHRSGELWMGLCREVMQYAR